MPYKDSERKRQWEREHREQRNARRRALRHTPQTVANPKAAPDPDPGHQPRSGWKDVFGLAVGLGIIILGALAGAGITGEMGSLPRSGNSIGSTQA